MTKPRYIVREWRGAWLAWDLVCQVAAGRPTTFEKAEAAEEALNTQDTGQ